MDNSTYTFLFYNRNCILGSTVSALSRFGLGRFGPEAFRPDLVGRFGLILIKPWQ